MTQTIQPKHRIFKLPITFNGLVLSIFLLVIVYFGYGRYASHQMEQTEASVLILAPQVNDIYFLDIRLLNGSSESKNKYKLAQVVSVTEENVALVYGRFYYQWQYSVVNSIRYGDLSNHDYFTLIPEYISFNEIKEMKSNGAIYLIKRPILNKVYGNYVNP